MHVMSRPRHPRSKNFATREGSRLRSFVETLLLNRGLEPQPSRLPDALAGLEEFDCCSFELDIDGHAVLLAVVPRRFHGSKVMSAAMLRLKMQVEALGMRLLAMPETLLRASAASRDGRGVVTVDAIDRGTVVEFFLRNGSAGLFELAGLLKHRHPVEAILELEVDGALIIEGGNRIVKECRVSLPEYGGQVEPSI